MMTTMRTTASLHNAETPCVPYVCPESVLVNRVETVLERARNGSKTRQDNAFLFVFFSSRSPEAMHFVLAVVALKHTRLQTNERPNERSDSEEEHRINEIDQ
jgi:hypothetical protein